MKLFIALTGLFMIYQPQDTGPAEILFLSGHGQQIVVDGETIDLGVHSLEVRLDALEGAPEEDLTGTIDRLSFSQPVEMRLGHFNSGPAVDSVNREGFLSFREIHEEGCWPDIRPECEGPMALQTCRDEEGRPLLAGRLFLQGGRIEPAEIKPFTIETEKANLLPPPPANPTAEDCRRSDRAEPWKVVGLDGSGQGLSQHEQTTYNGALYVLELSPNARSVDIWLGDSKLSLPVRKQDACTVLGEAGPCAFVKISNDFVFHSATKHKDVDYHFSINYGILDLPPGCDLAIPQWSYLGSGCETDGVRCIPPSQP